jgi:hypothetical protein
LNWTLLLEFRVCARDAFEIELVAAANKAMAAKTIVTLFMICLFLGNVVPCKSPVLECADERAA